MSCCSHRTPEDGVVIKTSKKIDREIKRDRKVFFSEIKLLLLGTGESGKSTFFKQMRILATPEGFTPEILQSYRDIVIGNTISQMKILIQAVENFGLEIENPKTNESIEVVKQSDIDTFSVETAMAVKQLWQERAIKQAYAGRDSHFQLNDSTAYFFENVERFADPSYVPTESDILRARVRSTGIEELSCQFAEFKFKLIDVGGQRSERKKWIHCFESVTAVIYCVALNEYDQTLREDETENRMVESIRLFETMTNSPWFRTTTFILFLNKVDLFREKIQHVDLKVCFPKYIDGCNFDTASSFIKDRFIEKNTAPHSIFTHFTCAVNTENVEFVFNCVKETLLKNVLKDMF